LKPDPRAQSGAFRKPNQHLRLNRLTFPVLDLGYASLSDAEELRRLDLRQPGAHFKLRRFFRREEVVKYRLCLDISLSSRLPPLKVIWSQRTLGWQISASMQSGILMAATTTYR
jgi:hypothetical protein